MMMPWAPEREESGSSSYSFVKRHGRCLLGLSFLGIVLGACMVSVVSRSSSPAALLSVGNEGDLKTIYNRDVEKGEEIIARMKNKVSNPVWQALVEDKHMRKVLAAALGAQKEVGAGGGGMDLSALFSPHPLPSHPSKAAIRHTAERIAKAHAARARRNPSHATPAAPPRRDEQRRARETAHQPPNFAYNVFAPGVLWGRSPRARPEPARKPVKVVVAPKVVKQSVPAKKVQHNLGKDLVEGLKKATGFDDSYEKSESKESKIADLERQVAELKKAAAQDNAAATVVASKSPVRASLPPRHAYS
jgi:hypothetical protein